MKNNTILTKELANCVRFLSIDAVQRANSGHPGMPMGMADIATVLFNDFLKFDPKNPEWPDRDRFILSNGHGSMLLYSCLYLSGYKNMTIKEIKNFRKLYSITAGHPEYSLKNGIETTTGPLAQGLANAVGMALAERILNEKFGDELIDHYTYVFAGDGCLMEGLSLEAASLAGHLNLKKLIVFFDNNSISIDGSTKLSTSDNHIKRFQAQGWSTLSIDGHDYNEIKKAIIKSKKSNKPSFISCKTKIGYGSPNKENTASSHGSPLGEKEIELTRKKLNWNYQPFIIPQKLLNKWRNFYKRNEEEKKRWNKVSKMNKNKEFFNYIHKKTNKNKINNEIIKFKKMHMKNLTECATRKASEKSLEIFNNQIDYLIGGSADLTGSNNTKTSLMSHISKNNFSGRYIYYGVREHAMASIMNGIALHKGLIPYGGTFLVFTDYCRPSIRLASLMNLQVIYVMTHDSIGLGEDGPTHQPIEHLSSLRAMPNINIFRPADIIETIETWECALNTIKSPSVIVLTRQNVSTNFRKNLFNNMVSKGAYLVKDFKNYHVTILSTGSEVSIALETSKILKKKNINARVVSMTCQEIFENQNNKYKEKILGKKSIYAIEAASFQSWAKYVKKEHFVGIDTFGASAPYKDLYKHFKITSKNLSNIILKKENKNDN